MEQLCRYITRPALANERVQPNATGQVELKLKTPWRDRTTLLVMLPLELMQRQHHQVFPVCRSDRQLRGGKIGTANVCSGS